MKRALLLTLLLASTAHAGPLADAIKREPTGPVAAPEPTVPMPASPRLQRALELYDQLKYKEAIPLLRKVIDDVDDTKFNRQRGTFFLGKAQFNLKRYDLAGEVFGRIVDDGPEHPYFRKTLIWMTSIMHVNGDGPEPFPIIERVAKYPDEILMDPAIPNDPLNNEEYRKGSRDEVLFRVGAWCRAHGQRERADKLWAAIAEKSPWAARAKAATKAQK